MAQTIQSLDRGLKILEILGKSDGPLSLNEITRYFDIDRFLIALYQLFNFFLNLIDFFIYQIYNFYQQLDCESDFC